VISPNDFASLDQLSATLLAFADRYNQTAGPFNWQSTVGNLTELLRRINDRERSAHRQAELATAA
jgi:hypothetical protein